jgi:hypothetical protein
MKRICFIDNFHRSEIFIKLSNKFSNLDNIYWITANKFFYTKNKEKFKKNILYIDQFKAERSNFFNKEKKINEIIFSDRILKNNKKSIEIFSNIENQLYNFIKKNKIKIIIGEFTWGHELLINRILKNNPKLLCKYYNIQPLRIPYNRSAFFINEKQNQLLLLPKIKKNNTSIKFSIKQYKKIIKNKEMYKKLYFLKIFKKNYFHKNDIFYISKFEKIKLQIKIIINSFLYKKLVVRENEIIKKNNKIKVALFALQKQPEAGIDVKSRYSENASQLIENIYKTLPRNWILCIKEHKVAIGFRNIFFYKQFTKKPNIFFLHEDFDISKKIKNFDLVITQAGTIAFEAALKNITSMTFADCFFNKLKNCFKINNFDLEKCTNIEELILALNNKQKKKLDLKKFSKFLSKRSFEGIVSDSVTDPDILNKNNIDKIYENIKSIL